MTSWLTCAIAITGTMSQPQSDQFMREINDIIAAAEEAAQGSDDEEQRAAKTRERIAEVNAAMRLIAQDAALGNKIPTPRDVYNEQLEAAVMHNAAWLTGVVDKDIINPLIAISTRIGPVLYNDWACNTGQEQEVADIFIDLLEKHLTSYPKRLFLTAAISGRDLMGYGDRRNCSAEGLERTRLMLRQEFDRLPK